MNNNHYVLNHLLVCIFLAKDVFHLPNVQIFVVTINSNVLHNLFNVQAVMDNIVLHYLLIVQYSVNNKVMHIIVVMFLLEMENVIGILKKINANIHLHVIALICKIV